MSQADERQACLERILQSKSTKKLIVAGPGTGKTYTFGQLLKENAEGNNIAMTFINGLVKDMSSSLAGYAEVRTFHSYCKKVLHDLLGGVTMAPYLDKIIESDAAFLGFGFKEFLPKFQRLESETPEVAFFLSRGDYYRAVHFDDAVYRVYVMAKEAPDRLSQFDQIVIDEYQDFNALECAFISVLEERGSILIVGDDDQAVYEGRNASPEFLRGRYGSGDYETFELPFCSRCTEAVVESTNAFLSKAEKNGLLTGRIPRRFECFIDDKAEDNARFPQLIIGRIKVAKTYGTYVRNVIEALPVEEIAESRDEEAEYPTVLVVGPNQYLRLIHDDLKEDFPQIEYKASKSIEIDIIDGYDLLLEHEASNLGWRVIAELCLDIDKLKTAVVTSQSGDSMTSILPGTLVEQHRTVLEIIRILKSGIEMGIIAKKC